MAAAFEVNSPTIARGPMPSYPAGLPVAVNRRLAPEIYRARRWSASALVFGLMIGVVVGAASVGSRAAASRGDQTGIADSVVVTVMPGDTLWAIAKGLAPDADPRSLVHELQAIAGKGPLQPGQQLVIPHSAIG